MKNLKKLFGPLIWIALGIIIHLVYVNRPSEELVLRQIEEKESIQWFNDYMEMPFSDIDTVQEIRNQTRVKRVEFTQETLKELNEINLKLKSPETIRLYFGNEENSTRYMVMAFESSTGKTESSAGMIAFSQDDTEKPEEDSQEEAKNQTDQIFVIEGKTPPTCPYVCDREGPYIR